MTLFWLGAVGLIIFAVVALLWPWFAASTHSLAEDDATARLNVLLTKESVAALEQDLQEGIIAAEERQAVTSELKHALVSEIQSQNFDQHSYPSAVKTPSKNTHLMVLLSTTLVALLVTVFVYGNSNDIAGLLHWQDAKQQLPELGQRVLRGDSQLTTAEYQSFSLALRSKLADQPEDAVGWLLLGRLYGGLQQGNQQAKLAFEKSLEIDPERPGSLISYGQLLLADNTSNSAEQVLKLMSRALRVVPDEPDALGLLAIAAERVGDTQLAIQTWQQLQGQLAPTNPIQKTIASKLQALEQRHTQLIVKVDIDSAIKAKLPQQAVLFVFARAVNGAVKVPAAVVKQPLQGFPISITLSDENAMVAGLTLSSLQEVAVIARISLDDDVAVGEGELQGSTVTTLTPNSRNFVSINIDQELAK